MKIEIKSIAGSILFEGDFSSLADALTAAVKKGAYLRGAYLRGADLQGAYLRGAYLQGAYLQGADLQGAYLQGAYFQGAYLQGAYLQGAYLQGAYLQGAEGIVALYNTSEWVEFIYAYNAPGQWRVSCGCRDFTLVEAREHWTGKPDRVLTLASVELMAQIAKAKKWNGTEGQC